MRADKKIMHRPMAQITCKLISSNRGLNHQSSDMTTISTKMSQSPRVQRNRDKVPADLFRPYRKAEVPARNTNTGAQ